jgi:hypothetical protein
MTLNLPGNQIAGYNAPGLPVNNNQIKHIPAAVHGDLPFCDLPYHSAVRPKKALLTGLSLCIKCAGNLYPAKRAVIKIAAVFARKRHTGGNQLVNCLVAYLCGPVNIGLPGPVIATLDNIIKQAINAVAVIFIIFCRIDPSLGGNRMCPAWRILKTEGLYIIAQLRESGGGRGS